MPARSSIVQPALFPGVPERIERWKLRAFQDGDGEVYAAYSREACVAELAESGFYHRDDFDAVHELSRDVVLRGTEETLHIGAALDELDRECEAAAGFDPRQARIVAQLWTQYA